ncbi:hypothetical protein [Pedobacter metabolipauper]|uniref:hypothetical protein n=1 Tax=Pedobacter metabolipauper TaxID=425513 RepID=UPI001FB5C90B|nr:hypothetical protein [Pedobacter metabolipauper]
MPVASMRMSEWKDRILSVSITCADTGFEVSVPIVTQIISNECVENADIIDRIEKFESDTRVENVESVERIERVENVENVDIIFWIMFVA